jgi:hypothetical protein
LSIHLQPFNYQCYQLYKNQEEHHKTKTFKEEYVELKLYTVDFKNEYLLMMLIRDKYVALTGQK